MLEVKVRRLALQKILRTVVTLKKVVVCFFEHDINPSLIDCVQNVTKSGTFLNNSRWYREKILQFFFSLFIEVTLR
jgi:hypothetical protein